MDEFEQTQFETVNSASDNPRFSLAVGDGSARVTRLGGDTERCVYFEIADRDVDRDVFPSDFGYVDHGSVWMRLTATDDETGEVVDVTWVCVGEVRYSLLRVGDSVEAEHTEPVVSYSSDSDDTASDERRSPSGGGCWICRRGNGFEDAEMEFDTEFDTYYHEECLAESGYDSILEYERNSGGEHEIVS